MPSKRSRACDACHTIKIKCNLGSDGGDPPCTRCVRLGKDCIITPPKRQKDRVAELEAQVASLTRLLEVQNIQANSPVSSVPASTFSATPSTTNGEAMSKKRRLDDATPRESSEETEDPGGNGLPGLDKILKNADQRFIFDKYVQGMMPNFSPVPLIGDVNYDLFRKDRPLLLQAIIYSACHGVLPVDQQEDISKHVTDLLARRATDKAQKSLDIIQAILTVSVWFRFPRYHSNMTGVRLAHYALDIAKELGLEGTCNDYDSAITSHTDSAAAWSTWLFCYLMSANMGILARRSNPIPWTQHEEILLMMLSYWPHGLEYNRLIAQYVRAERLCETLAGTYNLTVPDPMTPEHPSLQGMLSQNSNLLTDWRVQIPPSLPGPSRAALSFWEHYATILLHEAVLHTPTNAASFCAPFTAERLSITDFPAPALVTSQHVNSLCVLRDTCQAFSELYIGLPMSTLTSLPPILFAVRHLYSVSILLRVYIACTAIGNTYGAYVDAESLRVDEVLEKNVDLCDKLHQIDPKCLAARLSSANARLKEWVVNYRVTQGIAEPSIDKPSLAPNGISSMNVMNGVNGISEGLNGISNINGFSDGINANGISAGLDFNDQNTALDWTDFPPLAADPFEQYGYGLEDFFAEPFPDFGTFRNSM
ncbi:hypothetical protein EJ05DRAFT_363421 [Pseudovirgaria hyperparasitica]|uniref:Zn(2)-C6 fungal-type domain-containing protein n=1 Tax=Pseudovirgaria hyperparasitica TaxID=470096 RepID=A0A6A6WA74_9PEZI|nr:uncharacterized protein EJ05DRAFT_363421 [Pseudovirgaria hyperparasitica]KAF2758756.1 hypothetical protein EJ05DRAFT_363421 [Pseudovirgaria hyperparasitica]